MFRAYVKIKIKLIYSTHSLKLLKIVTGDKIPSFNTPQILKISNLQRKMFSLREKEKNAIRKFIFLLLTWISFYLYII
jgi:hypothetical protein